MNLQNMQKIGDDTFYFGISIRQSKKLRLKRLPKDRFQREKTIEIERINTFTDNLVGNLLFIEKSFPSIDHLDPFYKELIENNIGVVKLKKEIAKLKTTVKLIGHVKQEHLKKMRRSDNLILIKNLKKQFLGRVGSLLKNLREDLKILEEIRQELRNFPNIKTKIKTVCIIGYPNVGKSTLLRKLTTAKPEVNIYPFTTKTIMMGYVGNKLQVIDTPGAYRSYEEMNKIEKQAYLAIKHLSKQIIFVIDFTESCGYSLKSQEELLERIKKEFNDKEIIIYASKIDLMNNELLGKITEKNIFSDPIKLKEFLI